jgi:small-conductance mechanosensitive channel
MPCLGVFLLIAAATMPAFAQTAPQPARPSVAEVLESEAGQPAPVVIGGEIVLLVPVGAGPYTPQVRADRIASRINEVIAERTLLNPTVTVVENNDSFELRVGPRLLMVVTPADAQRIGVAGATMAEAFARQIESTIRNERLQRAPGTVLRSGGWGLGATIVFALIVWIILRLTRWSRRLASERAARLIAVRVRDVEVVPADQVGRGLDRAVRLVRLFLLLLAFDLYLTYVLGLFPWTRSVSRALLSYLTSPLTTVAQAFLGYLPNLLFVIVIALAVRGVIRLVAMFFKRIEEGRIAFERFPPEWADPTNKIARLLLFAFGVIVAFPYLPASDSPAFAGVSVFMGVLLSLSSSSAIANAIAGVVLTYTGAFRLGERVKIGDTFGDVIDTSMLATRVRTIKNEDVTIPNSLVLGGAMTNYSRQAGSLGLILHTSVTIGYDTPWRIVHRLLTEAAQVTPEIMESPRPFVWQTALNDFYVTYELNAFTANARDMVATYAALHANIQDVFFAAGVEIMSPHYASIRDGNTVAIPEAHRPPDYQSRGFRVERDPADLAPPHTKSRGRQSA